MDESNSGSEFDDTEDWKIGLFNHRVAFNWLSYNPDAFFPQEEYFYRTGKVPKIKITEKPLPSDWSPVFVIGCGRSGTTIVSKILSAHSEICFLNEPRSLWVDVFPQFDVWSSKSSDRCGQLQFTSQAASEDVSKILSVLYSVAEDCGKSVLVEKTPENTFRLDWLNSVFPNCKFIMVKRNPIQTARSISRFQPDTWFGYDEYKWKQIKQVQEKYSVRPT